MRSFKALAILLALLMMAAVLTGCENPTESPSIPSETVLVSLPTERQVTTEDQIQPVPRSTEHTEITAAETQFPTIAVASESVVATTAEPISEASTDGTEEAAEEIGERTLPSRGEKSVPETTEGKTQANFIANKNTKKFHSPNCSSVKDMKEENKLAFSGTREELIQQGYQPCKRCNP